MGKVHNKFKVYANSIAITSLLPCSPVLADELEMAAFQSRRDEVANFKKPEFGAPEYAPLVNSASTFVAVVGKDPKSNTKLVNLYSENRPQTKEELVMSWAALQPQEVPPAVAGPSKLQKVTTGLNSSFLASAQTQIVSKLTFVQQFKTGLKFNFSLKKLFSGSDDKPATPSTTVSRNNLRYGLILKDIEPDKKAPKSAAIGSISAEDLHYAGKAKASYTIGPIYEETNNPMFNVNLQEYNKDRRSELSTWDWLKSKAPSSNIQGAILPRTDDPNQAVADSGTSKKLPPLRFSLWQQDNLYTYNYETVDGIKKDKVTHVFAFPLYHTLQMIQERNEGMELTRTTFSGLLLDDKRPLLSMTYLHLEKRYTAELKYERPLVQVYFIADTPPGFKSEKIFKQEKEKYEVRFNRLF